MITCIFEDGNKAGLRHVTVNALVTRSNQILLGKRGTFKGKPMQESGKWALLGGFMGRDETLIEAVKREVMEESGYTIENVVLFRINDNPLRPKEEQRQNIDLIYLAGVSEKTGRSDEEITKLSWFDIDKTPSMDQIAFDHGDSVEMYKKYLTKKFQLPVIGNTMIR